MIRSWMVATGFLFALAAPAQDVKVFHPDVPLPSYDVATIKPPDPSKPYMGQTIRAYIASAFNSGTGAVTMVDGPRPLQTVGGPDWIDKDKYIITGKPSEELRQAMQAMTPEQRRDQFRMMAQSLLAERFHLQMHVETREMPVYELVPAKGGLKIKPVDAPAPSQAPQPPGGNSLRPGALAISPGGINARAITMNLLIGALRAMALDLGGRPIVDKTGFTGHFDVDRLRWASLSSTNDPPSQSASADLPSLTTALEEKLGMKLVPAKGQVEVVVIDSIDRPTEN